MIDNKALPGSTQKDKNKKMRIDRSLTRLELSKMISFGDGPEVPEGTIRSWENGSKSPSSAALSLVALIGEILETGKVTRGQLLEKIGSGVEFEID